MKFIVAFPRLEDGASTALVYLIGSGYCGSGGCMLFVMVKDGDHWRMMSRTTITRPPIYMLRQTSHGWHDIAVLVCGGGIINCYESEIPFDGRTYALNPSVPPARKLQHVSGTVVIRSYGQAIPLY
ncbi:MAG TPA: hypothetical protein VFO25_07700 [Candidatus Eremiobacteraceae bacterium]|nr:hypothetical protein [Candidatus Eremiobacteraceae bacterium]